MPRNAKYVCFKHRHSGKQPGRCPLCRNDLFCVGDRTPIPRKNNDKGWKRLLEWVKKVKNYTGPEL